MGSTQVVYSDATTAEAATILKSCGFLESSQGGLFTNPGSPVKVYVVWGKSSYYPEILSQLDFSPRIQIHLKCRDNRPELAELVLMVANCLRDNAPGTKVRAFNADRVEEVFG